MNYQYFLNLCKKNISNELKMGFKSLCVFGFCYIQIAINDQNIIITFILLIALFSMVLILLQFLEN